MQILRSIIIATDRNESIDWTDQFVIGIFVWNIRREKCFRWNSFVTLLRIYPAINLRLRVFSTFPPSIPRSYRHLHRVIHVMRHLHHGVDARSLRRQSHESRKMHAFVINVTSSKQNDLSDLSVYKYTFFRMQIMGRGG